MQLLLHSGFFKQATLTPEKIAIVQGFHRLTYQALERYANWISDHLDPMRRAAGEPLIAVIMEKSWEQIAAVLGILKAGAAYLPIDPAWPHDKIASLLVHSQVTSIITQPHLKARCLAIPSVKHVLSLPEGRIGPIDQAEIPETEIPDNALAYVIFTSGSTGQPKGVAIQHHAVVNTLLDIHLKFGVTHADALLSLSELHFDLSVYDIFGILSVGGKIVLPTQKEQHEPAAWMRLIASEGITLWNSVPAWMFMFLEMMPVRSRRCIENLPLRLIFLSGDWIPMSTARQIKSLMPKARLISLGGATEASIWSVFFEVRALDPTWKSIPYGKALQGQSLEILDASTLQPCEPGEIGEIFIGGKGLAEGYWKDPQQTASAFLKSPRRYRTGDFGRFLPDGNIEFLGRKDAQVKIHGYRIELSEIEGTLNTSGLVQQAIVMAHANRLYAWVFCKDTGVSSRALRSYLSQKLPSYMIPHQFFFSHESLPLGANGKMDRKALHAKLMKSLQIDTKISPLPIAYPYPLNAFCEKSHLERQVTSLWQATLQYSPAQVNDHFFQCGGNSLKAATLMGALNALLHIELPIATVFEYSTLGLLIQYLETLTLPGSDATICLSPFISSIPSIPSLSISSGSLVKLHQGGPKTIVLIHPVSGQLFCYQALVQVLAERGAPFTCFGIEAQLSKAKQSLSDLATQYCEALHASDISAPYCLIGWSIGGLIAFEMAHQLGPEQVSFLGLVDSYPPFDVVLQEQVHLGQTQYPLSIGRYYSQEASKLLDIPLDIPEHYFSKTPPHLALEKAFAWIKAKYPGLLSEQNQLPSLQLLEKLTHDFSGILNKMTAYRSCGRWVNQMTLFYTEETPASLFNLWQAKVRHPIQFEKISGTHLTLLEPPHVETLAEKLMKIL